MFLVGCLIYDLFQLLLGFFPDFPSNAVKKCLRFSLIPLEKSLEFISCDQDCGLIFQLLLMLLHVKKGLVLEKRSCKRDIVWPFSSRCGKMIITQVIEVVELYMSFSSVDVGEPSFQKSFLQTFEQVYRYVGPSVQNYL